MSRSKSWTFPKWGEYTSERDPVSVRLCDYDGCDSPGDYPAPKAPDSRDKWYFCQPHVAQFNKNWNYFNKWYFCQPHVAQFNKNWNYFNGLSREEALKRAQEEMRKASGYRGSSAYMGGADTYGKEERRNDALEILDLEEDATDKDIKSAYRRFAKLYHPDINLGDAESAIKFQQVKAAYEILTAK